MNKWLAIVVSVACLSAVGAFAIYTYGWKEDVAANRAVHADTVSPDEDGAEPVPDPTRPRAVPDDPEQALARLSDLGPGWSEALELRRGGGLGFYEQCVWPGGRQSAELHSASVAFGFGPAANRAWMTVGQVSLIYPAEADARKVEEALIANATCVARQIHLKWDSGDGITDLRDLEFESEPASAAFPALGDSSAGFSDWFWMTTESGRTVMERADLPAAGVGAHWVVVRAGRLVTVLSFEALGSAPDANVIEEFMRLLGGRIGDRPGAEELPER